MGPSQTFTDNMPHPRAATAVVHAGFVVTGIVTTLLGPLLPILIARWSMSDARAGLFFTLQFCASILGTCRPQLLDCVSRIPIGVLARIFLHGVGTRGADYQKLSRGFDGHRRLRFWFRLGSLHHQFVGRGNFRVAASRRSQRRQSCLGHWRDFLSRAGDVRATLAQNSVFSHGSGYRFGDHRGRSSARWTSNLG